MGYSGIMCTVYTVIMIHVCLGSFIYRATKEEEKAAIGKFD